MRKTRYESAPDLHCHSTFSLLDGFGSPKSVVERARQLGWGAACLTEHGWLGSVPPFYKAAREKGVNPILGCEMYVVPHDILGVQDKEVRKGSFHLTVLALSKEGYQNLVAWNNAGFLRENFYYRPRISLDMMVEIAPHPLRHNVILSGCMGGELCQAMLKLDGEAMYAAESYVESVKSIFPNFFIELQNHLIPKFRNSWMTAYDQIIDNEELVRPKLIELARATNTPVVVTNDSHYQSSSQRKAHIAMHASKMNSWRKDDTHGSDSSEHEVKSFARDYIYWAAYMRPMEEIAEGLDGVGEEAIENVKEICREADIRLDPLDHFSYSIPFSGYDDPIETIRRRCKPRLKRLAQKHGDLAIDRFEHELAAMGDFSHYLLMMSDFVLFAREQGILTNTRGSAANSIICYCLKIHDIDSIEYKLTFERFVNPKRKKLPDVDIDIEKDRYEDFMKNVQEYIAEREGEGQLVQLCNYISLANRSTFRVVADALGIDKDKQDEISKMLPDVIDSGLVDEEEDVYSVLKEQYPDIYELASGIFDNLKSVSQHACGWLIGTKDRPLSEWVPVFLIASSGKHVTQFNLKSIDDMGLVKGDWLRLRTLSVIKRCLNLIGKDALDLEQIPLDDPDTFKMLREGKTEGVFTVQGKTNRRGCIEVEVENVHDVIATVAIYRPALTRTNLPNTYNARRRGEEKVTYPHPIVEEILSESYGLAIFQEQVMDVGYAIGMTHEEIDDLYQVIKLAKGVGRGAKEAFEALRPTIIKRARGVMSREEAEGVADFMAGSTGYGFNRGHASSYGRLAVRAAYLKCHHPQAFFTSLLDVYPEVGRYIAAARTEGFRIVRPDINQSGYGFSRGDDARSIRIGLSRIHGVGQTAVTEILSKRPFNSVDDLKDRTRSQAVKRPTVEALAAVGALESLGIKGSDDDAELFRLLSFIPETPQVFIPKITPKHANKRETEKWTHLGFTRGVEYTPYKSSVSKLFWLPLGLEKQLQLKSDRFGRGKTWLLRAVDENGVAFDISADESKREEANYLKWMAKECEDAVICMDGMVKQPFDGKAENPLSFRLFDVTGAYNEDPQVWRVEDDKTILAFNVLHRQKRRAKRRAG